MAQASLDIWIREQRVILMDHARRFGSPPVAIMSMADVDRLYFGKGGCQWTPLPGARPKSAMAFRAGAQTSLWVNPKSSSYGRDFRIFLEKICNVDTAALESRYDIDHLYNRERANQFGYAYVMMFPVLASANRSHGAGYEKAIGEADLGRRAKIMKLMDTVSMLKLHSALSPRLGGTESAETTAIVTQIAAALQITPAEVRQEIANMLARAYA